MQPVWVVFLVVQALWELLRYDLVLAFIGFRGIHREFARSHKAGGASPDVERQVHVAVACAATLYWKRVQCLQRASVLTRLLRRKGIAAMLVIGYQSRPFFGHAWSEVEGRVVGDSAAYGRRLQILDRT